MCRKRDGHLDHQFSQLLSLFRHELSVKVVLISFFLKDNVSFSDFVSV